MMISVYYKKKTSLNGYLCDMDTARKHGRTFSALCDLQYPYSIDFECDTTILSCYIDYLGEIDRTMKRQIEFLKILPEIQKAYGSLFIYNNKHCEMTKDAERLIMEQCIEWEED